MNTTYLLFGATAVVSFGAGWVLKPQPESEVTDDKMVENVSEKQNPRPSNLGGASQAKASSPRNSVTASKSVSEETEETQRDAEREARRDERRKQMQQRMVSRQQKQFDAKISALVTKLGLNAEQEEQLRAHYASKIEDYEALMEGGWEQLRKRENVEKLSAVMGDDGLDEALAGILTEEQQGEYTELKARERTNEIESSAMKQMASIQGVIDLEESQKDAVFEILHNDATNAVDNKSPFASVIASFSGGMMMDTSGWEQRMAIDADDSLDEEQKKAKIEEVQKASLEAKVSRFDGVLTESQQKQYRQHLENQNQWMRGWGRGRRGR